jgi:hypothetical protein
MNWDDTIEYDGGRLHRFYRRMPGIPTKDLITYLELALYSSRTIGSAMSRTMSGRTSRRQVAAVKGVYDRTAGELIESFKKHPDDLGATVGDWKGRCRCMDPL